MKTFTNEYVETLESHNYFGQLPDQSAEQQSAIRQHWLQCMAQRGWTLGTEISDDDAFDNDCLQSLIETHNKINDFYRHWYDALQHFNVPFGVNLPWTDELDLFIQKANNYATDMVDAGDDPVKVAQVRLQHGIFIQQAKPRGGTRAGAGRPKVHGLKRRSTTATDDEWQAMISARNEIRQRNRQAPRIND